MAWRQPRRRGYWLVASDGGIFSFGAARSSVRRAGSISTSRSWGWRPPPTGGVLAGRLRWGDLQFGDAHFYGSTGVSISTSRSWGWPHPRRRRLLARRLRRRHLPTAMPVLRIDRRNPPGTAHRGHGSNAHRWGLLVHAADGGLFNYGDAPFLGSGVGTGLGTVVDMALPTALPPCRRSPISPGFVRATFRASTHRGAAHSALRRTLTPSPRTQAWWHTILRGNWSRAYFC